MLASIASRIRLARDDEGATIIEFALIAPVLILILLAGIDFGHRTYVSSVMQGALTDAARRASVEDPTFSASGDTLEERVANAVEAQVQSVVTPGYSLTIEQSNFYDFTGIGNPEKIMRDNDGDGVYDADDGDCFSDLNENGQFDTDTGRTGRGGANDVVFYEATLEMDPLVPIYNFLGGSTRYTMLADTAIRNQPWGSQATPPTVCGTAVP